MSASHIKVLTQESLWLMKFLSFRVVQEVICGKCTVLCTSKDARNQQPSEAEINNADFFFSQIYDVDLNQFKAINEVVDQLGYAGKTENESMLLAVNMNQGASIKLFSFFVI